MMKILLTNDDSIHAPGFAVLEDIARQLSDDVWCVAPEMDRSGVAHSITELEPLRVKRYGEQRWSVRGTPADCVMLAIRALLPEAPDLILSGVNSGANMGNDVLYSGTVGAAIEGALFGITSIAISQHYTLVENDRTFNWAISRDNAPGVIQTLLRLPKKDGVFYNLNFPDCAQHDLQPLRVVGQYRRPHAYEAEARLDGRLMPYYWNKAIRHAGAHPDGTDARAIADNAPSLSAFSIDMTDAAVNAQLRAAFSAT